MDSFWILIGCVVTETLAILVVSAYHEALEFPNENDMIVVAAAA